MLVKGLREVTEMDTWHAGIGEKQLQEMDSVYKRGNCYQDSQ